MVYRNTNSVSRPAVYLTMVDLHLMISGGISLYPISRTKRYLNNWVRFEFRTWILFASALGIYGIFVAPFKSVYTLIMITFYWVALSCHLLIHKSSPYLRQLLNCLNYVLDAKSLHDVKKLDMVFGVVSISIGIFTAAGVAVIGALHPLREVEKEFGDEHGQVLTTFFLMMNVFLVFGTCFSSLFLYLMFSILFGKFAILITSKICDVIESANKVLEATHVRKVRKLLRIYCEVKIAADKALCHLPLWWYLLIFLSFAGKVDQVDIM